MRPLLVVLHDLGSADPADIMASAGDADVLFVCDRASPYVDAHFSELAGYAPVLDMTGAGVVDSVMALEPAGVVTFSDFQLGAAASVAAACGLPGHSPAVAATLTDKSAQRRAMRAAGVQATGSVVVRHESQAAAAVAEVGLPAVVKPRHGAASVHTSLVGSVTECAGAIADFRHARPPGVGRELVVEELLVGDPSVAGPFWGDYVSVESIVCDGDVRHVCVTGRTALAEPFRETGCFVPCTLPGPVADAVLGLATRALRALGVQRAVTHTEIKLTAAGPRVIEVNGRMGGFVGKVLRRSTGYDLLASAIRLALGEPVSAPSLRFGEVAFCCQLTAPASASRLPVIDAGRLGRLPGVEHVDLQAGAGDPADWRAGSLACAGHVYGAVADHGRLRRVVESLNEELLCQYA